MKHANSEMLDSARRFHAHKSMLVPFKHLLSADTSNTAAFLGLAQFVLVVTTQSDLLFMEQSIRSDSTLEVECVRRWAPSNLNPKFQCNN